MERRTLYSWHAHIGMWALVFGLACNQVGRPEGPDTTFSDTDDPTESVDDSTAPIDETDDSDPTDVTDPSTVTDPSDITDPGEETDASSVEPVPEEPTVQLTVLAPGDRTSRAIDDITNLELEIAIEYLDFADLRVAVDSSLDGRLAELPASAQMTIPFSVSTPGTHLITVYVMDAERSYAQGNLTLGFCGWVMVDDFNASLDDTQWLVFNDAYWDSRGWIEMTGNTTSRKGAIFGTAPIISPQEARMRFKIATGQCNEIGSCFSSSCSADGFAMSVYPVETSDELLEILETASAGGGLGFHVAEESCAVSADCPASFECRQNTCVVDSFHIEFDTYYNGFDPTSANHMAIMLGANSRNHLFHQSVPTMEDNEWHTIEETIQGTSVSVQFDDLEPLGGELPEFQFKGGALAFTGSTGACTNYHRFDDVEIEPTCRFGD